MSGFERNTDLAVGLEAANARAVTCSRIDNHEGAESWIDFDALRRDDPHEAIINWPVELPAVHYEFDIVMKHVRDGLLQVLTVLITALAHYVPKQDAALSRID
jgi:hypothetical protein